VRHLWYSPDGQPIDVAAANALLADDLARRIAHTTITTERGQITVSTVFLCLDHAHFGGPPILWETMTFGGPDDQAQQRYASREAAEDGHREAVTVTLAALDAEGVAVISEDTFTGAGDPS
jgi:hypothetical protein